MSANSFSRFDHVAQVLPRHQALFDQPHLARGRQRTVAGRIDRRPACQAGSPPGLPDARRGDDQIKGNQYARSPMVSTSGRRRQIMPSGLGRIGSAPTLNPVCCTGPGYSSLPICSGRRPSPAASPQQALTFRHVGSRARRPSATSRMASAGATWPALCPDPAAPRCRGSQSRPSGFCSFSIAATKT